MNAMMDAAFKAADANLHMDRGPDDLCLVRLDIGPSSFGICQPRNGVDAGRLMHTFLVAMGDLLGAAYAEGRKDEAEESAKVGRVTVLGRDDARMALWQAMNEAEKIGCRHDDKLILQALLSGLHFIVRADLTQPVPGEAVMVREP